MAKPITPKSPDKENELTKAVMPHLAVLAADAAKRTSKAEKKGKL
jgi:hypothetical protein